MMISFWPFSQVFITVHEADFVPEYFQIGHVPRQIVFSGLEILIY
jgi:hypothetical protein